VTVLGTDATQTTEQSCEERRERKEGEKRFVGKKNTREREEEEEEAC
jgi:hypothetical protein